MKNGHNDAVLDKMLEPVSRCFNPDAARALVSFRFDDATQARVDALAGKCNEGQLTIEEKKEYEAYVQVSTLIGILQSKARRILAQAAV